MADRETKLKITGDPAGVEAALKRATSSVEKFTRSVNSGSKMASRDGGIVEAQIKAIEASFRRLEATGQKATAEQVAAFERLKAKAEETTTSFGQLRAGQADFADKAREATVQAGEYEGQIRSLNDILQISLPTLGKWALGFAAITAVAKQTYGGTRALIGSLKDLGVDVDAAVQRFPLLLEGFVEWDRVITDLANGMNPLTKEVRDQAREVEFLANANNILAKRFGETAASAAEAAEKLQRLNREVAEEKVRAEEMNRTLFGTAEAMHKSALATVDAIRAQEKLGKVTEEGKETIKNALQEILDNYAKFGAVAPAQIQTLADKYGVVTTIQERFRASVELLSTAFEGNAQALAERDRQLTASVAAVEKDGTVTEAAKERIKKAVTEQLDAYVRLGGAAPEALQKIADKYGAISTAQESLTAKLKSLEEQQRKALEEKLKPQAREEPGEDPAAAAALAETQKKAAELKATIAELEGLGLLSPEQLDQLFQAKDALAGIRVEAEEISAPVTAVAEGFISAEEAAKQLANAEFGPRLSEQIAETTKKLGDLESTAERTPVVWDEATKTMTNAAAEFSTALITTDEKGQILLTNLEALRDQGGSAIEEVASAGADAAGAMDKAASAADKAASGVEKLGAAATEVDRVGSSLDTLEPKLRTILDLATKIKTEFAAWDLGGDEAPAEGVH